MFKKFTKENITSQNLPKTSAQRGIRQAIIESYPSIEPYIMDILPKKEHIMVAKCQDHINLIIVNNEVKFFSVKDGPYIPSLKILHVYPFILPKFQVDNGAIKFIFSGAPVMCPGLTSPGGAMVDVPENTVVAIMAEGKETPLAIGITILSTQKM